MVKRHSRSSRSSRRRRPRSGNAKKKPGAALSAVIETLLQEGFVPDGETVLEHVRVPTMRSPVFGGTGGELRTFGGRARFRKPGTPLRVTVGPRTVNVYVTEGGKTRFLANYNTGAVDFEQLRTILRNA